MARYGVDVAHLTTSIPDFYRKSGWERDGLEYLYKLDQTNVGALPGLEGCRLVECYAGERIEELHRLYQNIGVGSLRDQDEFFLKTYEKYGTIHAAEKNGKLVGYVIVSGDRVVEHAGERAVSAGLVKELFRERFRECETQRTTDPARDLTWQVCCPPTQTSFGELLESLSIPKNANFLGMLYVVNPRQIIKKIGCPDVRFVQDSEEGLLLAVGDQQQIIPYSKLARMVFGPEKPYLVDRPECPTPLYLWPADKV